MTVNHDERDDVSILCWDGFCDSCQDDNCEHRCHYQSMEWKRSLERGFLRVGIAALPAVVLWKLLDGGWLLIACAALLAATEAVAYWFEKDWSES